MRARPPTLAFLLQQYHWPAQPCPSPADWKIWQQCLSAQLQLDRYGQLQQPLGPWVRQCPHRWYYHPQWDRLYEEHDNIWRYWIQALRCTCTPRFHNPTPTVAPPLHHLHLATVATYFPWHNKRSDKEEKSGEVWGYSGQGAANSNG